MSNQLMATEPSYIYHTITLPNSQEHHPFLRDIRIEITTRTISSKIALFLGISEEYCAEYIGCAFTLCNGSKYITLDQVARLWDKAHNNRSDKYKPILAEIINNQIKPLFNQNSIINKEIDMTLITTNEPLTMSSLEMAKLTETRHDSALRTIKTLIEKKILLNTNRGEYKDNTGRTLPCYLSDKRDSLVIVARLSPEFTAKVVDRWQELENNTPALSNNYKSALTLLGVPEQIAPVIAKVYEERDTAVKTKCQISDKKTATAMATASILTQKVKKLEAQLNQSHEYATVRTVERFISNIKFNWRWLKKYSNDNKLEILDVVDPLYGQVKSYHAKAWEHVYGVQLNNIMKGI